MNGNAQWRGEAAAPRGANMNFCLPQTALGTGDNGFAIRDDALRRGLV